MGFLAAFGKVGGATFRKGAQHDLDRAARRRREGATVRNIQRRRAFIRKARAAQAENLVAGVATGAGLESSAFQGTRASLQTQTEFAKQLDSQARLRERAIANDQRKAQDSLARAQGFETFMSIGDDIVSGLG